MATLKKWRGGLTRQEVESPPLKVSTDSFFEAEFRAQEDAKWRIQDAVSREKDFATKVHGGALALIPVALGAIGEDFTRDLLAQNIGALFYVGSLLAVLGLITYLSFVNCDNLRLQQQELDKAANIARWGLARGRSSYFTVSRPEVRGAVRLRHQRDPVGNETRVVMGLAMLDLTIAILAFGTGLVLQGYLPPVSSAFVGIVVFLVALWLGQRHTVRRWKNVDKTMRRTTRTVMAQHTAPGDA